MKNKNQNREICLKETNSGADETVINEAPAAPVTNNRPSLSGASSGPGHTGSAHTLQFQHLKSDGTRLATAEEIWLLALGLGTCVVVFARHPVSHFPIS